jgi:hypothetical protein
MRVKKFAAIATLGIAGVTVFGMASPASATVRGHYPTKAACVKDGEANYWRYGYTCTYAGSARDEWILETP